jgi:hypothetical protein
LTIVCKKEKKLCLCIRVKAKVKNSNLSKKISTLKSDPQLRALVPGLPRPPADLERVRRMGPRPRPRRHRLHRRHPVAGVVREVHGHRAANHLPVSRLFSFRHLSFYVAGWPGTDVMIYIFAEKFCEKLAFLDQNKAKLCKNWIITLVFEKNSQKIVIITSTPGGVVKNCIKYSPTHFWSKLTQFPGFKGSTKL